MADVDRVEILRSTGHVTAAETPIVYMEAPEPARGQTTECLRFQLVQAMVEDWPDDIALDRTTVNLIGDWALYEAQSIKLFELAES